MAEQKPEPEPAQPGEPTASGSTPVKPSAISLFRYARIFPEVQKQRVMLVDDMSGRWIGPVPVDVFLEELMYYSEFLTDDDKPPSKIKFPESTTKETDMYKPFFRVLKKSQICPEICWHITAHSHGGDPERQRPDGGASEYPHEPAPKKESRKEKLPFDWHRYGLMVEFKGSGGVDPFLPLEVAKEKNHIENTDEESTKNLGQLAGYMRESFIHQHRSHLFQLFIIGNTARFIRWDRAGAIVSAPFNYVDDPKPLVQFFWTYGRMSPAQRGWDMTVTAASADEKQTFSGAIEGWIDRHGGVEVVKRRFPGAELTLDKDFPTYKLTVEPGLGKKQELVIRRPFSQSYDIVGRVTRAYFAYSLTESRVVFYKDGWRVEPDNSDDTSASEATAYELLSRHQVPNTPIVLCAGDVTYQGSPLRTISDRWARKTDADWYVLCSRLRKHILHRIVQEIAYPVQWLVSSWQFAMVLRDCSIAIGGAFEHGILHRDISIGNVMAVFDNDGKDFVEGILNDWDHFGYTKSSNEARSVRRSGTWPFMSISILEDPATQHTVFDDLQSIYWVLLYGSFRYFDNSLTVDWGIFFDRSEEENKALVGGHKKRAYFESKGIIKVRDFTSPGLRQLIREMEKTWCGYYGMEAEFRLEYDDESLTDLDAQPEDSAIRRLNDARKATRRELSVPSFWTAIFNSYFKNNNPYGMWPDDAVQDKYPQHKGRIVKRRKREAQIKAITTSEASRPRSAPGTAALTHTKPRVEDSSPRISRKHARDEADAQLLSASSGSKKARIAPPIPSSARALTPDEDESSYSDTEDELEIIEIDPDDL